MQAGPPLAGEAEKAATQIWLTAQDHAVKSAQALMDLGVHKQVANRLLEPFMWHTVICSATDWTNFFEQRCSPLAQPEIRVAAESMKAAQDASTPNLLIAGEWHLPYLQPDEIGLPLEQQRQLSAARCARVSYLTHDGTRDHEADFILYRRLVEARPPHASPLEHVATPGDGPGNFTGWRQLRHQVIGQ